MADQKETKRTLDATKPPKFTPGIYRHYKGDYYEAESLVVDAKYQEWLVLYKHFRTGVRFVRSYEEWTSAATTSWRGSLIPRFDLIIKATDEKFKGYKEGDEYRSSDTEDDRDYRLDQLLLDTHCSLCGKESHP
jgi:hypothetical protein